MSSDLDIENVSEETIADIEKFLKFENYHISRKLGVALIENFGGITEFLDSYQEVSGWGIKGGYGRFVYFNTMVDFYKQHKKQIRKSMESIAEENGFDSLGDFIWDQSVLSNDWSKNEVLEALYTPANKVDEDIRDILYSFQVQLLGTTICQNYEGFLDRKENDD